MRPTGERSPVKVIFLIVKMVLEVKSEVTTLKWNFEIMFSGDGVSSNERLAGRYEIFIIYHCCNTFLWRVIECCSNFLESSGPHPQCYTVAMLAQSLTTDNNNNPSITRFFFIQTLLFLSLSSWTNNKDKDDNSSFLSYREMIVTLHYMDEKTIVRLLRGKLRYSSELRRMPRNH